MPNLDGRAFYKALADAGNPLQHRLIFVTGDTMSPRTLDFLESSGVPYLAKPFLVEELKQIVQQASEARERGGATRRSRRNPRPPGGIEETMNAAERNVFLICADPAITRECIREIVSTGGHYQLPLAASTTLARESFRRHPPTVIFLDESAADADHSQRIPRVHRGPADGVGARGRRGRAGESIRVWRS